MSIFTQTPPATLNTSNTGEDTSSIVELTITRGETLSIRQIYRPQVWMPNTDYTVGDRVRFPTKTGYYLEALTYGKSNGDPLTPPPMIKKKSCCSNASPCECDEQPPTFVPPATITDNGIVWAMKKYDYWLDEEGTESVTTVLWEGTNLQAWGGGNPVLVSTHTGESSECSITTVGAPATLTKFTVRVTAMKPTNLRQVTILNFTIIG